MSEKQPKKPTSSKQPINEGLQGKAASPRAIDQLLEGMRGKQGSGDKNAGYQGAKQGDTEAHLPKGGTGTEKGTDPPRK